MRTDTNEWDVRCSDALRTLFPPIGSRHGYWYKVNREMARRIVTCMATSYGVPVPTICETNPGHFGMCCYRRGWKTSVIYIWPRAHIKTVFHEFYHHVEFMGLPYDSSDKRRRAWEFGDRVFAALGRPATPKPGQLNFDF